MGNAYRILDGRWQLGNVVVDGRRVGLFSFILGKKGVKEWSVLNCPRAWNNSGPSFVGAGNA
jgi:hypothetical protein